MTADRDHCTVLTDRALSDPGDVIGNEDTKNKREKGMVRPVVGKPSNDLAALVFWLEGH